MGLIEWVKERFTQNSFTNVMKGLNTWKDTQTHYNFRPETRLSNLTLVAMYQSSPSTRKIINSLVDDGFRQGIDLDHDLSEEIINLLNKKLNFFQIGKRGAKTSRQFGEAFCFYHINDGQETDKPVNHKRIKDVRPYFILSKNQVKPMTFDQNYKPIEWFAGSEIEFYQVLSNNGFSKIFHKSRVLIFKGDYAGEESLNTNNGFYESVIDSTRKAILAYEVFGDSVTSISDSIIQEILKVEGLETKLKQNREEVYRYLQSIMMGKSVVNKIVLDKKDDFQYHSANLSGYKDISQIVKENLSMSSGIPLTKFFGTSPSASIGSQSGGYEEKLWINDVITYQNEEILPNVNKALEWIKPLLKLSEKEIMIVSFPSLFPMDDKTITEIRKSTSETDRNYIDKGVLTVEEVRKNRFKSRWTMNTTLMEDTSNV